MGYMKENVDKGGKAGGDPRVLDLSSQLQSQLKEMYQIEGKANAI